MKYTNTYATSDSRVFDANLMQYMYLIYKNMGIALLISALVSFFVGTNPALTRILYSNSLVILLVQLSPLLFSFYMGAKIMNSTPERARNLLYIFAALMGLSLSSIFLIYTRSSIVQTFLTTAITFGIMSLYGYTTKKDLSSLGSFLFMGLVGILVASILNIFFKSSGLQLIISFIGVIVFTLYTAYDVQNLKKSYNILAATNSNLVANLAIMGALQLYMDFINLFLFLLRFLGNGNRE